MPAGDCGMQHRIGQGSSLHTAERPAPHRPQPPCAGGNQAHSRAGGRDKPQWPHRHPRYAWHHCQRKLQHGDSQAIPPLPRLWTTVPHVGATGREQGIRFARCRLFREEIHRPAHAALCRHRYCNSGVHTLSAAASQDSTIHAPRCHCGATGRDSGTFIGRLPSPTSRD